MKIVPPVPHTPPEDQGLTSSHALAQDAATHLASMGALVLALSVYLAVVAGWGLFYAVYAVGFYALSCVGIWRGLSHHRFAQFGSANGVTLCRLAVVSMLMAMVAQSIGEPRATNPVLSFWGQPQQLGGWVLLGVLVTTAVLDAVDGTLARRSGMSSHFGARFDMETDAAFIAVMSVLVVLLGQTGAWIVWGGLMRYVFVAAGYVWPWLRAPLPPSRRRQTICVVQVGALVLCLTPLTLPAQAMWLGACSVAALTLSFVIDVRYLAQQRQHP